MSKTIKAISDARTNAALIAEIARLGYLRRDLRTLDPTYGKGNFYASWRPEQLVATDLNPAKSPSVDGGVDFTALPFADGEFPQVIFDGPYQYKGGDSNEAWQQNKDAAYGVRGHRSPVEIDALLCAGLSECARVLAPARRERVDRGRYELVGGVLVVKCQDQVVSANVRRQVRTLIEHGERCGLVWEDDLHLVGYRPQPERSRKHGECRGNGCDDCHNGRVPSRQEHAARNFSTALIMRKMP